MCGIAGVIDFKQRVDERLLRNIIKTLSHRGPDNQHVKILNNNNFSVGLAHARLSIIDLSCEGDQPMEYKDYIIVFNGEIYNYIELKKELFEKGHHFTSHSDTEIIMHAFEEWGTNCVDRFIGMFAFALYDKKDKKIYLFRDRAGVKPLYYYIKDNLILFASELKALYTHPRFIKEMDINVLKTYFNFGYISSPNSIFKNTYKLSPACFLILDLKTQRSSIQRYWDIEEFYKRPKLNISFEDVKEEIKRLLVSAFNYRMVSDVPVGVFLSGGYDSTAVAAILQHNRAEKLKTFTIGTMDNKLDEAPFAREVAKYLGTEHIEHYCTTKEAQSIIPSLPYYYDEPFADSSAIPTTLVSQLARKQVKVALSADGGDEIFAGYVSHITLANRLRQSEKIPNMFKPLTKKMLSFISFLVPQSKIDLKHKLNGLSESLHRNKYLQTRQLFEKMVSLPNVYMNQLFVDQIDGYKTKYDIDYRGFQDTVDIALAIDYQMYLPNDILTKVDRATMSASLEGREPFLDHRIIEFVAQLPLKYKLAQGGGKHLLKEIVHEYVPKELMDRPKAGFGIPIYEWLKGDLSYLLEEYLNERSVKNVGLFNQRFVKRQIRLLKEDKLYYKTHIWKLLIFQMWYKKWM